MNNMSGNMIGAGVGLVCLIWVSGFTQKSRYDQQGETIERV